MELDKDFIETNKLSEDQVKAVSGYGKTYSDNLIADTKKTYDGKANADAEAILNGAAGKIAEITSIARNQGEKMGEFISRSWGEFSKEGQTKLEKAQKDYEDKIKDFKGDDATREELEKARLKLDDTLKKYADYDTLKETADKYNPLLESNNSMKMEVSFGQVKPSFPDTVNEYEAAAKWAEFKSGVLKTHTIELVDGVAMAVDKENVHKVTKLKDLIAKDESINKLLEGRQQKGSNANQSKLSKVEGVPFDVPENALADAKIRSQIIKEHLTKAGVGVTDSNYSKKFTELNNKIMKQKNAA